MIKEEHSALPAHLRSEAGGLLRTSSFPEHRVVPVAGLLYAAAETITELRERLASAEQVIARSAGPEEDAEESAPPARAARAAECRHTWGERPADAPADWRPACTKCGKSKGKRGAAPPAPAPEAGS